MNIKKLLYQIRNSSSSQPQMTDEVTVKFLRVLEQFKEEELSCGEFYAVLDEFVETEIRGGSAHKLTPLIRDHLDICSECCDEYEALLAVIEHTKDDEKK